MNDQTPQPRVIHDDEVHAAVEWLIRNARALGTSKGAQLYRHHRVKIVLNLEKKKRNDMPVSRAEIEAYTTDAYQQACWDDAMAAAKYEEMRALQKAAEVKIEAWRSEQANRRSVKF